MRSGYYILDDKHRVVPVDDALTWARWLEGADRFVKKSVIDDVKVSPVFLGLDHQYGDGPPLVFETMVFGGAHDEFQERCSTWEEAEQQHERVVRMQSP